MASTVWRGFVTFGLISIPVRLFRAARAERVSFRRLYRAEPPRREREMPIEDEPEPPMTAVPGKGRRHIEPSVPAVVSSSAAAQAAPPVLAPVQQVSIRKGSDKILPEQSVVKGYEYEKDRFVVVEREELKSIAPKTATEMEIQEFVNLAEIDPVYFETSYYLAPEEAGAKAYALLYRALQETQLVAVAQFAMHSREHVVILRPGKKGIIAHTMFFSSEVRADEEYHADAAAVTPKELQLAETLIHSLTAPFQADKYRDTYREKIESIIARKVAGQPVAKTEMPARAGAVVDIAEALQKSLAALKKPAASDPHARKPNQGAAQHTRKLSRGAGHK